MAVLEILTFPDPRLREECLEVEVVDDELKTLARDMAETMYAAPGVGLAAPQVGVSKRLIVCDVAPRDEPRQLLVLLNPEVVEEEGLTSIEEGCLSCPEIQVPVDRAARVRVEALDLEGNRVSLEADELLAVVLQHEIDHLEGELIVDRLSNLKRSLYRRKQKKEKSGEEAA